MNGKCMSRMVRTNYFAFFQAMYAPRLKAIDVLLKTMEDSLSVPETAKVLGLTEEAVESAMTREHLAHIDRPGFLRIMAQGGNDLCGMYQRETACGSPVAYKPQEIAYIYRLQAESVQAACDKLGLKEVTARTLPSLLRQIPIYILYRF